MENTGNGKDKLFYTTTQNTYLTLHTTTTTISYDKHGVPPTKRLFRVAMLDPSQGFIDPWGKFGDLELPSVNWEVMPQTYSDIGYCREGIHPVEVEFNVRIREEKSSDDLLKCQEAENCHEKAHHTFREHPRTYLGLGQGSRH
ncbi:hypothetical protein Tco_0526457 [Tanacetum coccineum]